MESVSWLQHTIQRQCNKPLRTVDNVLESPFGNIQQKHESSQIYLRTSSRDFNISFSSHQCSFRIFVNPTPCQISHLIAFAFPQFIHISKVFLASTKMYSKNQRDYLAAAVTSLLPAWARLPPWRIWYCSMMILNRNFLRTDPFRGCFRRFLIRTLLVRDRVGEWIVLWLRLAKICFSRMYWTILLLQSMNSHLLLFEHLSLSSSELAYQWCRGPLSRMHSILLIH